MRLISFSLTTPQFVDGSKDITRRLAWKFLKVGTRLRAVEKAMGLKKGEHPVELGIIEVTSVRREQLCAITQDDVHREGFPGLTPLGFTTLFCRHMKCNPRTHVTRIEFKRVSP